MDFDEIKARFGAIDEHNRMLLTEIASPDFDGDLKLDPTMNNAQPMIHLANEAVVLFPQGAFPLELAKPCIDSTDRLLAACRKRYGTPLVKAMEQAFHKMENLWYYRGAPLHPPELFVGKVFKAEQVLIDAICNFNVAIVSAQASQSAASAKPKARRPRTSLTQQQVADDFGISRKQLIRWETMQTTDGPDNTSNPYGYYKSLRTNPELRSAYDLLAECVRTYRKLSEANHLKGKRAISFVTFNEKFRQHSRGLSPAKGYI